MAMKMPTMVPKAKTVARALGWFSMALGMAELVMPRRVSRLSGMGGDGSGLLRAYGAREAVTGAALLMADNPTPWLWARVAGDALDVATVAARGLRRQRKTTLFALGALAGVALVDVMAAKASQKAQQRQQARRYDYSDRSGFPRPAGQMRGAALKDFEAPRDMKTPEPLRPRVPAGTGKPGPQTLQ